MKWIFKTDQRLLLFPISILLLTVGLCFVDLVFFSIKIILILWSIWFLVYFYFLHIKKSLNSSCSQLRYIDENFQILQDGEWVEVELLSNSLVSSWLLALHWHVLDSSKTFGSNSFFILVVPSSMQDSRYKQLTNCLQN